MNDLWGAHWGSVSSVCPRCGALVHPNDEAKAAHDAFHVRVEPPGVRMRRIDTPMGERVAYVPADAVLPDGWFDLGPYESTSTGPDLTANQPSIERTTSE